MKKEPTQAQSQHLMRVAVLLVRKMRAGVTMKTMMTKRETMMTSGKTTTTNEVVSLFEIILLNNKQKQKFIIYRID